MSDPRASTSAPWSDGPHGAPPLPLVADLLRALDDAGVSYCHWKSNEAIGRTLSAENDLDLLIARRDITRFNTAAHGLGFRVARPSPDRHVPGMVDYFGRDEGSGRMVHVQAHFQLVLGDDATKNFRLPVEEAYLGSRFFDGPVAVPSRAFELLIFILRMVVKHCSWDAQLARQGRLTLSERRELEFLIQRSHNGEIEALRAEHVPFVSAALLARCRAALDDDADRATRAVTAHHLLRALDPFGRRPPRTDLSLRVWRRLRRRRQVGSPASRRALDGGGLLVGVLGGDGSGKSSAVSAAEATFSRWFPTYSLHLGKPPRSMLTRATLRSMRRFRVAPGSRGSPPWTDWDAIGFPRHGFVLLHTLIARDRYRTYSRARRAAARGALVISDRFPIEGIGLMDSSRIAGLPGVERRPLARWLADREHAYHRAIEPPDLLIVLRVDPDLAAARRPEQDGEFVRRRAAEVWAHAWTHPSAVVVDASQPHEAVLDEVRTAIWNAL